MGNNVIKRFGKICWKLYKWIGFFTLVTILKQMLIEKSMDVNGISPWKLGMNIFIIWALYSVILLLPDRFRIKGLLIVYALFTFVMFGDLVHYRYFQMPISVYSFCSAGQVGSVVESVRGLIKTRDIFIFVDIVLIWYILAKKGTTLPRFVNKERLIASVVSVLLVFFVANIDRLKFNDSNFTVNQLGLINYHLHDIVTFFGGETANAYDIDDYPDKRNNRVTAQDRKAYGLAEGRNIFVIQIESFQNFVINRKVEGKEITPVLNKLLKNDTFYFDRYYQQVGRGNTSDAEFVSHNSLYASMKTFSYKEYEGREFYTLPVVLKQQGYGTIAFHGNEPDFWNRRNIYPSQGLDTFISEEKLVQDEIIGMGISDGSVFRQSIDYYKRLPQPFYSFFITLTSHNPFVLPLQYRGLNINGKLKDTKLGNYMESVNYFDRVLGDFIKDLKQEGLYDNSMIVLYGDHHGLDVKEEEVKLQLSDYLGKEYRHEDMLNIPLIVHVPGMGESETVSIAGGHLDFFPTMLNLLGIEPASDNLFGQDLLNAEEGFTAHQTYLVKGSFIDDEKVFEMSRDGKFENSKAWYIKTGEPVDLELCREGHERAVREIDMSNCILSDNSGNKNR